MFGFVRRTTMDAAVAREREIGVEATAQAFEYSKRARVAEERAERAERLAEQWEHWYHRAERHVEGLLDRLEARAFALPTVPRGRTLEQDAPVASVAPSEVPHATSSATPKPAPEPMPLVLSQQVVGYSEDWAREDVSELFEEERQRAGSWRAVVGPLTDPTAGIVAT